jgi:hypothetical protein
MAFASPSSVARDQEAIMKQLISLTAPLAFVLWAFSVSATLAGVTQLPAVPEPASWLLLGSGLAGLAAYRWYRKR